ncbi:glycosyltransferase family 4 protein [Modestobacter versicolor]|uniref:glycosyltransferase family 4 protein n=1 Tax=Modestobacter versicolor TaxID=429133 RepID=UPI0034DDFF74
MRVGLVVEQALGPVPGGTGRYARELAGALGATAADGDRVEAWTAWHRDTSAAGPAVHRLPLPRRPLVLAWERGLRRPVPTGVDLVHAPTLLAPVGVRVPLVVTVHDAVPWTHPDALTPRGVAWHRRMAGLVAARADAVVVPTRAVADALDRFVPLRRVAVVGEGVSGDLAEPADAAARAVRLGLPEQGFLLSLATLEPRKGLDVLVEALARPGVPDLPLLVVGQPGWGDVDLAELTRRAGLPADRVRPLGRLSDPDLAVVLHRARLLVMPSRAEGFGLPVLEAMHAGTPVVCSDDPALAEVGGDAVVTAAVGDPAALAAALTRVLGDDALRAGMSARGRVRAATQTWTGAAEQLWALYRELVEGR